MDKPEWKELSRQELSDLFEVGRREPISYQRYCMFCLAEGRGDVPAGIGTTVSSAPPDPYRNTYDGVCNSCAQQRQLD